MKDAASDPDSRLNTSDDAEIDVLEDSPDDPVVEELTSLIDALGEDEQIDPVAIAWLGRGDYTLRDWSSVREEAAAAHNEATARYLPRHAASRRFRRGRAVASRLAAPARNSEIGRL